MKDYRKNQGYNTPSEQQEFENTAQNTTHTHTTHVERWEMKELCWGCFFLLFVVLSIQPASHKIPMGAVLRCCQHVGIASSQLETCLFFASATCALFNVSCVLCATSFCVRFCCSCGQHRNVLYAGNVPVPFFFVNLAIRMRCVNQIRIFFESGISFNNMNDAHREL